jgi:hypothetical protein
LFALQISRVDPQTLWAMSAFKIGLLYFVILTLQYLIE